MSECKHSMKQGCVYCHVTAMPIVVKPTAQRRRAKASPLAEKMNDRMTVLKRRLREIRGGSAG